ncbi:hypothetical protein FUT28_03435 [Enterococcus durans]|nr:hypothetical protein FS851_03035 [Enterococcus durans]QED61629.1 hypothetical protein FUT28_03435 [Enterococcus durans]
MCDHPKSNVKYTHCTVKKRILLYLISFIKRLGQKCLTPRNKKKLMKIAFQIFVDFGLFKKELLLLLPFIHF